MKKSGSIALRGATSLALALLLANCGGGGGGGGSSTTSNTPTTVAPVSAVSSSISGTIHYSGSLTGPVYVYATDTAGTTIGTSVPLTGSSPYTLTYTLRGATTTGSYTIKAFMDAVGSGVLNQSDPTGSGSATVATVGNNVSSNSAITLTDPAAGLTASSPGISYSGAADSSAYISWSLTFTANTQEQEASGFHIYSGTTSNPTTLAATLPANQSQKLFTGLTNGQAYYFKVVALVGQNTESGASTVIGPITVGATTGANTVSGSVSFPGTANGPLIVALFNFQTNTTYYKRITAPVSPQSYSISGVANGTEAYYEYAFIDTNNNGMLDGGDLAVSPQGFDYLNIAGNTTQNLTLESPGNGLLLYSTHDADSTGAATYSVHLTTQSDTVLVPLSATLQSGPHAAFPADFGYYEQFLSAQLIYDVLPGSTAISKGDTYTATISYANGSSKTVSQSVSEVLAYPTGITTSGADNTKPTISWTAPSPLPSEDYSYYVFITDATGTGVWSSFADSTTTSLPYGSNYAALTPGTHYTITVSVRDDDGNESSNEIIYTPPVPVL